MKIAVSIPDDLFNGAELLARKSKKSRSQLYGDALREYVARHGSDEVTEAMNRVCGVLREPQDGFAARAAQHVLERTEW